MFKLHFLIIGLIISSFSIGNQLTEEQKELVGQRALRKFAQAIWTEAMEAKQAYQSGVIREDLISNFATTAPRNEFIVHADLSQDLQNGTESADVYVSMDNQNTWQSSEAILLGTDGYENTYESTLLTSGGNSVYSYLRGIVDSGALSDDGSLDYGTIIVSSTPHNVNGNWPPSNNLFANLINDPNDASSDQDIVSIDLSYKGNTAINDEGEEYTDIERFYVKLNLNGNCCSTGSLFGPWYLYGVGLVNPEAPTAVAYAIGYGDGGFGQLTPGLLKITGDLSTGEIGGFEYLTTNIDYNTNGNSLTATALMSYITQDSDWGPWPNSFNGFIAVGVTVSAGLDGLDVAADVVDETDPGMFIGNTIFQDGNIEPILTNPSYDENSMELSVNYTDEDGNLPWWKNVQICYPDGGSCFLNLEMIPTGHEYKDGVIFYASLDGQGVEDGLYEAKFWFSDDDNIGEPQTYIDITLGTGGCGLMGDSNGDGSLNVLDVVLLVNLVLAGGLEDCSDMNGDGALNVLDVVLLVNIILAG